MPYRDLADRPAPPAAPGGPTMADLIDDPEETAARDRDLAKRHAAYHGGLCEECGHELDGHDQHSQDLNCRVCNDLAQLGQYAPCAAVDREG